MAVVVVIMIMDIMVVVMITVVCAMGVPGICFAVAVTVAMAVEMAVVVGMAVGMAVMIVVVVMVVPMFMGMGVAVPVEFDFHGTLPVRVSPALGTDPFRWTGRRQLEVYHKMVVQDISRSTFISKKGSPGRILEGRIRPGESCSAARGATEV